MPLAFSVPELFSVSELVAPDDPSKSPFVPIITVEEAIIAPVESIVEVPAIVKVPRTVTLFIISIPMQGGPLQSFPALDEAVKL